MLVRQDIAGVPVSELVDHFGTPLYVYDAAVVLQRLEQLRHFDVVRYAQKACSNLAVLALLRRAGALVDAVSAGEIHRALAAGYRATGDPPPIVYCADVFDRPALELVVRERIHVNCGSLDMIEQYGQRISGQEITLRINPGFGHGHSLKTNTGGPHSKHGIWHEQLAQAIGMAERFGLKVTGLHMHIGSGSDFEHLAQVCGAMEKVALMAKQAGADIRSISAPAVGFLSPIGLENNGSTFADITNFGMRHDARLQQAFGHSVRLEIEPGRYLSRRKRLSNLRDPCRQTQGSNRFYLLDAGFNCLARPILYGAYHPMSVAYRQGATTEELWEVVVGGAAVRIRGYFHPERGGLCRAANSPGCQSRRLACSGMYRGLRFYHGFKLQFAPLAGRGPHS